MKPIVNQVGAGSKNVVVFTAGWAMKMVPMLGSMLKDLLLHPDLEPSPVRSKYEPEPNSKLYKVLPSTARCARRGCATSASSALMATSQ